MTESSFKNHTNAEGVPKEKECQGYRVNSSSIEKRDEGEKERRGCKNRG